MITAARPVPRISAGRIRWCRLADRIGEERHEAGRRKQAQGNGQVEDRHQAEPEVRHRQPEQRERVGGPLGRTPRRTAATTPAPTPITLATRIASTDSSIVTGNALTIIVRTGSPVRIDCPRSPRSRMADELPELHEHTTRPARTAPGSPRSDSGSRSSPASASAGSPGSARTPANTTIVARINVTTDCHNRLRRYAALIVAPAVAKALAKAGPDDAVRVDLDAEQLLRDAGEVALAVHVDAAGRPAGAW